MKQVVYDQFGDPAKVLRVAERDTPVLQDGQARVSVLRAPINPSDLIQIAGQYGVRPKLPAVAGNEGLGRVSEVNGPGIEVGQLVLVPAGRGTWVSELIADVRQLVPLPEGDVDQLSMLMINPPTAHLLLTEYVSLQPGDWVIQSAANSAVGGYLVQLAKALKINVCSVVRRESAVEGLKELEADCILVDGPDLARRVKTAAGQPMKLAVDAVAGRTFGNLVDTLAPGGTIVGYGAMSGEPAQFQAAALIFRDIRVRGFWLAQWFETSSREDQAKVYKDLTTAIAGGTLFAPVDRHFALSEITEAVSHAGAGARTGKVLLAPNGL